MIRPLRFSGTTPASKISWSQPPSSRMARRARPAAASASALSWPSGTPRPRNRWVISSGGRFGSITTASAFSRNSSKRLSMSEETRGSTTNTGATAAAACSCSRRSVASSFSTRNS